MGWVEARDHAHAAPDPLAEAAPGSLAHMNADHVDAMILLAGSHAGFEATEATMTSVDRLGFSLKLKTNDEFKSARINFLHEVATRRILVLCSSRWYGEPRHEADTLRYSNRRVIPVIRD
jgi:hypothetical protein